MSEYFLDMYYDAKNYTEIQKESIANDDFIVGYIDNLPYEGMIRKSFTGLTNTYLSKFADITGVTYKYIEYDLGELGEPVRLRDKNYIPTADPDDLVISILKFDMNGIVKALKKMPYFNDGSAEKSVLSKHNLKARILLDTMNMGEQKNINGVIEINIPEGFYIKGDYLNDWSLPRFILKEDKESDLNIAKYQFFMPLAIGVEKDNVARRVFVDTVTFPFSVERADVKKSIVINGDFSFELCDANETCEMITTEHRIKLKKSDEESPSMYYNYVTQSHARLPKEELKFAKLSNVVYDKTTKQLAVFFNTTRKMSNIAVMVEDKKGTHYVNPKYRIEKDRVIATFDVNFTNADNIEDVVVSALFDDRKTIRKVVDVEEGDILPNITYKTHSLWYFYLLGLIVNLMPGVFYLYLKLLNLIIFNEKRVRIYIRYCISVLFGISLYLGLFNGKMVGELFTNPWWINLALFIEISLLFSILGYMDFILFRPLKRFFKYGVFYALFSVILMFTFPPMGVSLGEAILGYGDFIFKFKVILAIFGGIITLPLIGFYLYKWKRCIRFDLNNFNALYGAVYAIYLMYVYFCTQGIIGFFVMIFGIYGMLFIWYHYPNALSKVCVGKLNNLNNKRIIKEFQQKTLVVVSIIYLISSGITSVLPKKEIDNPSLLEIEKVILDRNEKGGSTIVAITADWSFMSFYNKFILRELVKRGMGVAYIDVTLSDKDGKYWFDKFHKKSVPLFILFNKRHSNGLVLPDNLKDINFNKTVQFFD